VDPITRQNLDDALDRQAKAIEKNMKLVIAPIKNTLEEHHKTLYGEYGNNGIKGAVKGLTLKVKLLIIIFGIFFTTGLTLAATVAGAFITSRFPGLLN